MSAWEIYLARGDRTNVVREQGNTILIHPNIAAKQKEYQEMTVKTFYLASAEAKNVANTLKTILKSRGVVVDEKLNLVILRDSPEAVKLASQLVALQDVPEAEVMLDVEVLEVQRNRLLDLGIDWPTTLSFAPLQTTGGGAITLDQLRHLGSNSVGVTGVAAPSPRARRTAIPTRWPRRASACATRKRPRSSSATSCRPSRRRFRRAWAASRRSP